MKLWVVGHAYVAELAHGKLQALAALPEIDLTLLVPTAWRTALGLVPLSAPPAPPYRTVASRLFRNGRIGAHVYRDGMRELRRARPDVVQAEVEPWSLAALQCALAAPAARLVIFTWENLEAPLRRASRARLPLATPTVPRSARPARSRPSVLPCSRRCRMTSPSRGSWTAR